MKHGWKVFAVLVLMAVLLLGCAVGGKDGVTPRLRISETTNMWEVSYDNGLTWESLGVLATGTNQTSSAYQNAVSMGYTGTASDFVALLLGNTTGETDQGPDGTLIPPMRWRWITAMWARRKNDFRPCRVPGWRSAAMATGSSMG